ncbi:MAG: class I adenylate-forming enzyme family protein [Candidatus Methylacidiphilales bacterium]
MVFHRSSDTWRLGFPGEPHLPSCLSPTSSLEAEDLSPPTSELKRIMEPSGYLWHCIRSHPGNDTAVFDLSTGTRVTWSQIRKRVVECLTTLEGLPEQSAVGLALPNSVDWIVRFLSLLCRRCPAVLLDAHAPASTLTAHARAAGARWMWQHQGMTEVDPTAAPRPGIAAIKLTSGSTGLPKGVACSEAHLIADARQVVSTMGIRPGDRQLALIPLGHSYALGNLVIPMLLKGNPLYTAPDFSPLQIPGWIQQHHLDVFPTVPIIIKYLTESPSITSLSPLRTLISAGAPLRPELASAFARRFGLLAHNFYGSSETGGICYDRTGEAGLTGRAVGSPLEGVGVSLSPEQCVVVSSPAVAAPEGIHTLEDTGCFNAMGELVLTGRTGEWVNVGGKKIRPEEIMHIALQHPLVRDAWAGKISRVDREWMKLVVATDLSPEDIRRFFSEQLPSWKIPREIRCASNLPRSARGKLDRTALESL